MVGYITIQADHLTMLFTTSHCLFKIACTFRRPLQHVSV